MTGFAEVEARDELEAAGLDVSVTDVETGDQGADGTVTDQRPQAGTEVAVGSAVEIQVGRFTWSDPITVEGSGDDLILDFQIPGDAPAYVTAEASGDSNFVVESYDEDGERLDLLFNAIAPYEGGNAVNLFEGDNTRELEVQADGSWTLTFRPIQEAPRMRGGVAEGESDAIVLVPEGEGVGRVANVTHSGDGNFVIDAYGPEIGRDLLVNEIGDTDVRERWSDDIQLLQIMAEGTWRIEVSDG